MEDSEQLRKLNDFQQIIEDENTTWYVLAREKGTTVPYRFAAETPEGCRTGLALRPNAAFTRERANEIKDILEKNGYETTFAKIRGEYDVVSIDSIALNEIVKRLNKATPSQEF